MLFAYLNFSFVMAESEEWIQIQTTTFLNWVNVHVCSVVSFLTGDDKEKAIYMKFPEMASCL